MKRSNIIHLNKEIHSFAGWKVSIQRLGCSFVRYFSSREYGGEGAAYEEAARIRDEILSGLERSPEDPEKVFSRYRLPRSETPEGLGRPRVEGKSMPRTCTLRCGGMVSEYLERVCQELHLDRSSVMRLSLYMLVVRLGRREFRSKSLREMIGEVEEERTEGVPCWKAFVAGRRTPYQQEKRQSGEGTGYF